MKGNSHLRNWFASELRQWHNTIKNHGVSPFFGWSLTAFFAIYLFIVLTAHSSGWNKPPILLAPIWIALLGFLSITAMQKIGKPYCLHKTSEMNVAKHVPLKIGILVFLIHFFWLLIAGSFASPDTINQMKQVQECCFGDWHPILHTVTMYAISLFSNKIAAMAAVQILIFSILVSWLYKTVNRISDSRVALALSLFVALNPVNFGILRVPWKDVAFALSAMGLSIALINTISSDGKWLCRWRNLVLLSVLLFLGSFYRHNGIFLTIPMCIGLLIWRVSYDIKWRIVIAITLSVFFSAGYIVTIHSNYMEQKHFIDKETDSGQFFAESVGLLMCGICEAYMQSYERTPTETRALMACFGDYATLKGSYGGDYNSIKFRTKERTGATATQILNRNSDVKKLIQLFVCTAKAAPGNVFAGIKRTTAIVWDPMYSGTSLPYGAPMKHGYDIIWPLGIVMSTPVGWAFGSVGLWMLILICLLTIGYIYRGYRAWLCSIPLLCYGFGTMLMLCGNDWRFFYAVVLCAPISVVGVLLSAANANQ